MMLIHEISRKLGITPRAIRFYEQKGLLSPTKMKVNGYRTYTEQDAWRLQTIISLREVGMTLDDIKLTLLSKDPNNQADVIFALQLQRSILFQQWTEMKEIIGTMDRMIDAAEINEELPTDQLYELAQRSKAMRDLRRSWSDHWDFDAKASGFDSQLIDSSPPETNPVPLTTSIPPNAAYQAAQDKIAEFISPTTAEKGLDIGTGTGNLASKLQHLGATMFAIDQSKEMLKRTQSKYPQIELKLGNVLAIPFMDRQFDFVVSSFALHHLTEPQRELAWGEIIRVLKPEGRICLADYMLSDTSEQATYIAKLNRTGAARLPMMHEQVELYPVHTHLVDWLKRHTKQVTSMQIEQLIHVVYAQK
ncbi:methyltransferase domain-containing protein [Paenibacillus sp. SYP-B3998]|uniref:Methyltransferase domain-containing protein n=1 Tax=Paenibacillus sp. SYP-B3998 TaxID=2678564 RepID=A0A6G4A0C9_9BACL|nr:MerR family transcriptional regulator [Paenibacillus sp. SYP-B3998]NEW07748.1 methyltransferase domain-containing protein [Paenibacillus sp. SYP-B3998]